MTLPATSTGGMKISETTSLGGGKGGVVNRNDKSIGGCGGGGASSQGSAKRGAGVGAATATPKGSIAPKSPAAGGGSSMLK